MSLVSCVWSYPKHFQISLHLTLSHAVDEVEDFKPVQNKPQLECDTEADGMCLISKLHMSWLIATLWQCSPVYLLLYITVEEVDVTKLELAGEEKPQHDFDRDSAMGPSVFTSRKSTTLSDVSLTKHIYLYSILTTMLFFPVHQDPLDRELEELNYELTEHYIIGKSTTLSDVSLTKHTFILF